MDIKVKKLNDKAVLPIRAHPTDAGFDLTATSMEEKPGMIKYGTGLAFEIPVGYVGLIFPRSSIASTGLLLSNCVGVIDSGYRGEVMAKFRIVINSGKNFMYGVGERIAQMIVIPYPDVKYTEVTELSPTPRGDNGFGSTGK